MLRLSTYSATQPRVVDVLATGLRSGRLHHAFILAGPDESGAAQLAKAAAASLVCADRHDQDACGVCDACQRLAKGNHPDVVWVAPDEKAHISIDAVRGLAARLALRAAQSSTKVAIIERADCMAGPTQNALLKTLEEPPGPTCFFLTTARWRTLLATVRSRCLTLRLAPGRNADSWRALVAAGIEEALARRLAALAGSDVALAQALIDRGAPEILGQLETALQANAIAPILEVAADLAADRDRFELALSLLEVEVRDRLAILADASPQNVYSTGARTTLPGERERLGAIARHLQVYRRERVFNVNRSVVCETLLLSLAGRAAEGRGSAASLLGRTT